MPRKKPNEHDNDANQKQQDGNAIHPVHQKNVDIPRLVRISFFQKQVLFDLIPDSALWRFPFWFL
jgi:hypothetical protein